MRLYRSFFFRKFAYPLVNKLVKDFGLLKWKWKCILVKWKWEYKFEVVDCPTLTNSYSIYAVKI